MAINRSDVLAAAREILCRHSLADLSMRRLAAELGVSPNALYWHYPDKQTLLAALGDDILSPVAAPPAGLPWDDRLESLARDMRATLTAVPDSAELVSSSWSSGLSSMTVLDHLTEAASAAGQRSRRRGPSDGTHRSRIAITTWRAPRTRPSAVWRARWCRRVRGVSPWGLTSCRPTAWTRSWNRPSVS